MSEKITKLTSALRLYQKYEDNQLTMTDFERSDMHFKFLDGSDIVIEETGLHCLNPHKYSLADLANWSIKNTEHFISSIEAYQNYYNKLKTKFDTSITIEYKPYFEHDGFDTSNIHNLTDADKILDFCRRRILDLRMNRDDVEATAEIEHRRKNIFDVLYCLSGKNLDDPLLKLYTSDLSTENTVTVLQSVWEEEYKEDAKRYTPYSHKSRQYSIGEIIEIAKNANTNLLPKEQRQLVLPNTSGRRFTGDKTYRYWSGLQIFDIDLKFSESFLQSKNEDASSYRDIVFDKLKKYPWFVGVVLSSSKRALHIYTKVSRMHHLTSNDEKNAEIAKYWYRMSYVQKHAIIAYVLEKHAGIEDVYTNKRIIDSALARIHQGIAINYDAEGKWSTNFIDTYIPFGYHIPPDDGLELSDWLLKPELLDKYKALFYDNAKNDVENENVKSIDTTLRVVIDSNQTIDEVRQINMQELGKGERYNMRWRVCNTLAYSYGDTDKAKDLAFHILQAKETNTENTVESFLRSAILNKKEADTYTVKLLKRLGLQITFDDETVEELEDESMQKIKYMLETSKYSFDVNEPNVNINLGDEEYLGMIMPQILYNLKPYKLNLLASAPNTGKTEFFKSLAKKATVCLVIPFTSTIDSKIVNDKSITDLFEVYYGKRSVSDIKRGQSVVMTFDKFSSLPKSKYEYFKYIAIDESHLAFTSIYRLPVVSKLIENIRTYLEKDSLMEQSRYMINVSINNALRLIEPDNLDIVKKSDAPKFILMTGTITGEVDYFNHYGLLNYIQVHKRHPYRKNVEFILSKSSETKKILICKHIAKSIEAGKKIIHPTNAGDTYAKQILAGVEILLKRPVKFEYYKRANSDEEFMEDINKNTTTKDIELLFCSDYLSVGIDIKDSGNFEVIFNNDFTAEAIEQFNNRLRSTNINCKIFYDVLNSSGDIKPNIINTKHIEYVHNDELGKMIQDEETIAKLQKSMSSSNRYYAILGELFSKYFITDYSGKIKYIKAAFEIEQFELQYSILAKSLLYVKSALETKYQYHCKMTYADEFNDRILEFYDDLLRDAKDEHLIEKDKNFRKLIEFFSKAEIYRVMTKENYNLIKETISSDDKDELGLHMHYDATYHGGSFILSWDRKYKFVIQSAIKFVTKFRKLYTYETIKKIFELSETSNGLLNRKELHRYEKLMSLIFNDKKEALSESTKDILELLYEQLPPIDKAQKITREEYELIKMSMKEKLELNLIEEAENTLQSERRIEQLNNLMGSFIEVLFHKRLSKTSTKLQYRKIFAFDSETVNQEIERDKIFRQILLNDNSKQHYTMTGENVNPLHIENKSLVSIL